MKHAGICREGAYPVRVLTNNRTPFDRLKYLEVGPIFEKDKVKGRCERMASVK